MSQNVDTIQALLKDLPCSVNREEIYSQWQAIWGWFDIAQHTFPRPAWSERGFEHYGPVAWKKLSQQLSSQICARPISMYIHVPFCENRCGFCDLFSTPLPRRTTTLEDKYTQALCQEMASWSSLGNLRNQPITTIHFGGGTPGCIQEKNLRKIVATCCEQFVVSPRTELAIESTSRLLSDDHLTRLLELGFSRLHVGVQTLNNSIRLKIGRREKSNIVISKLNKAIRSGLIVSVDIIYGLPGQNHHDITETLEQLTNIGVHGFSFYQLQKCEKNDKFLRKLGVNQSDALENFILYQIAEQYMRSKGYGKNFFTHFALPQDQCLYYHHVKRNENLLAMGPTADGVFDGYYYRHPDVHEYTRSPAPSLEGGMRDSPIGQALLPIRAALMTAKVNRNMFIALQSEPLLELWLACCMLMKTSNQDEFELTANGSWFITQMLLQLHNRQVALSRKTPDNDCGRYP